MIVSVSSAKLRRPIALFIPDDEWETIKGIENKNDLNKILEKKSTKQIAEFGYSLGKCGLLNKDVYLTECLNCGIGRNMDTSLWEDCKERNVEYKFVKKKVFKNTIKDAKLSEKISPRSKSEQKAEQGTFSVVDIPVRGDSFEKESESIMKPIKDKENKNV